MSIPTSRVYHYPKDEHHYIVPFAGGGEKRVVAVKQAFDGSITEYILETGETLRRSDADIGSHRVVRVGSLAPETIPEAAKPSMKYPDGNPKTAFGIKKPPTWYISPYAMYQWGLAALHGALKYGHFNWRKDPVSASTYLNAAQRHIDLYKEGEQCAKDSHVHHLAHVMACCAIIIDAEKYGTLIDDRFLKGMDLDKAFEEMAEVVEFLHERWGTKQEGPIDLMADENTDKEDKNNG